MAVIDDLEFTQSDEVSDDGVEKDPYSDLLAINSHIEKKLETDKFQRSLFERGWFRNILFFVGQQWIIFDKGRWRPRALPAWFPRAQTNKFAEKYNDIVSALVQGRVPITYSPATDSPEDAATAEVGERVREVIYEEAKIEDKEMELASWMILTGNSFLITYYDTDDKYGTKTAPVLNPETGMNEDKEFPIGNLCADVCSPFEIRLDHRIRDMADHTWFCRLRRYELSFAKDHWADFKDQITSDGGTSGNELSNHYLDVLAQVTDAFNPSGGMIGASGAGGVKNPKVTAYEFYELPTEDYPEGLRVVRLGTSANAIVEAGPLPTEYGAGIRKGQKFLPIVHFGFDLVPGRLWKKTRMDDMIPLQIFRNTVEANLRLTAQRMGNAMWLNPKGSGVSVLTGEPGQQVDYNPVSLGGTSFAKPERIPAELSNLQPLIILINKIDDSMERVAGTFFLQGGDTPPGVTAASALAYLGERAQKSMSPLMREWAKGWKRFEEMGLEIARQNWDDQRIRIVAGKNRKWETQKFTGADLQGAVNLVIDYQGLFPKSNATERATIQQLVQMGVINPADPEENMMILQKFGSTSLKGSIDIDKREAQKEQDNFMNGKAPELIPLVQNSTVHLMEHNDFAKTDEFKDLPPEQQAVFYAHIKATMADIVTRRMMFAQMGQDGDSPLAEEVSSGEAELAAQMTEAAQAQQAGGALNTDPNQGATPPGVHPPQATAKGNSKGGKTQAPPTPDIAAPGDVPLRPIQQPRTVDQ